MIRLIASAVLSLFLVSTLSAHTSLKATHPESGSILSAAPEQVTLEFLEPVRLTQLRIESALQEPRRLKFMPNAISREYSAATPDMGPGRNAIHWTALAADGHVIEGTIILVVRAAK